MDLVTFLRVLLRRWDVVLPGLLLTGVTVLAAGSSVASAHEAEGSLLLLSPSISNSSQGAVPTNPYLNIPSSLGATAVIMAESMSSEETRRELADLGATADYELKPTEKTPILTVTAEGSNREQVLHTAELVLQRMQHDLSRRQLDAGAPEQSLIRSEVLSTPRATTSAGNKPRVMAAVGALGLGITVMLAFAVESLAAWRTRRREGPSTSSVDPIFAFPHVPSEPPLHFSAEPNPAERVQGNGWHPHPPSEPLVDVVVGAADLSPAYEEVLPQHEVPGQNGNLEQQEGLVDAWWSAWERRQGGRRGTHDAREPTTHPAAEVWAKEAPEAGSQHTATSSPREVLDDDEEANSRWDEDLRDQDDQADGVGNDDDSESLRAWDGRIEVLGGTADVEAEAVGNRSFVPRPGGRVFIDESDR